MAALPPGGATPLTAFFEKFVALCELVHTARGTRQGIMVATSILPRS
jgi:hypothetical protein